MTERLQQLEKHISLSKASAPHLFKKHPSPNMHGYELISIDDVDFSDPKTAYAYAQASQRWGLWLEACRRDMPDVAAPELLPTDIEV